MTGVKIPAQRLLMGALAALLTTASLAEWLPPAAAQTRPPARWVVRAAAGAPLSGQEVTPPELARLGLRVIQLPAGPAAAEAAQWLRGTTEVIQQAQPVWAVETLPNDPGWSQQYGPALVQAPQAWEVTTGTLTITIAVVDTGIDLLHPDLAGKIVTGTTLITGTASAQDDNGHGTHAAGIAAAYGNNGVGVAGLAWNAALMPVKVLDRTGFGEDLDVATGIIWAVDHGADVINLSLGGECPSPVMELAVTYAYTMGVTVAAAAGNSGRAGVLCPAVVPSVLAIAAVDAGRQSAPFSTYGPEVDLAAPGLNIYSTLPTALGSYGYKSGTSMATPYVAGAAALLMGQPGFDTPDKIRAALEGTALDLGHVCRDIHYGAGLLQLWAALQSTPGQAAPLRTGWCHFVPALLLESPATALWLNPPTTP